MTSPENARSRADGAASAMEKKTETKSAATRTVGGRALAPNFGPVPVAAANALAAGSFPSGALGFAVYAYLVCHGWRDGRVETTIAALVKATAWPHSPKALRMLLAKLVEAEWLHSLDDDRKSGTWGIGVPTRRLPTSFRPASDLGRRDPSIHAASRSGKADQLPTGFRVASDPEEAASDLGRRDPSIHAASRSGKAEQLPTSAATEREVETAGFYFDSGTDQDGDDLALTRAADAPTTEEDPMTLHTHPAAEDQALISKLGGIPPGPLRDRVERDWRSGDGGREVLRACVERATLGEGAYAYVNHDRLARFLDETPIAFTVSWGCYADDDEDGATFATYAEAAAAIQRLRASGFDNVALEACTGASAAARLGGEAA